MGVEEDDAGLHGRLGEEQLNFCRRDRVGKKGGEILGLCGQNNLELGHIWLVI
jgi:hypothetical protein